MSESRALSLYKTNIAHLSSVMSHIKTKYATSHAFMRVYRLFLAGIMHPFFSLLGVINRPIKCPSTLFVPKYH